ncbi:MAG: hypothetical protein L3J14_09375 [Flavobacteriaceae bacterium]|nr:hypothetical protein [Flavobacteriaceae bacterium]
MKKVTYTTIILLLLTSFSVFAGDKPTENKSDKQTEIISLVDLDDSNVFIIKNDNIQNTVSYLTKHQYRKSSSRKSKMKNVQNFLRNPEKKENTIIAMC